MGHGWGEWGLLSSSATALERLGLPCSPGPGPPAWAVVLMAEALQGYRYPARLWGPENRCLGATVELGSRGTASPLVARGP